MMLTNTRNINIDFLRGIAILAVLFHHFHLSYHLDQSALNTFFSLDLLNAVGGRGNYGVTMFFVISGFLITSTALERYGSLSSISVLSFYLYRFARIVPCLVLALGLIFVFHLFHFLPFENKEDSVSFFLGLFSVFTFWHNVLMAKVGYFNYCLNIFWSLSVEEIFYLSFPLLCVVCKKLRFILPVWFIFIVFAPVYRHYYSDNEIISVYGYFSCFDAIAMGCCAAILEKKLSLSDRIKIYLKWNGALIIAVNFLYVDITTHIAFCFSLVSVGTMMLLMSASIKPIFQNRFTEMVCWFGRQSYELYLFHIIILAIMRYALTEVSLNGVEKLLWMLCFFVFSALLAGLIARFYSQPINRRLRKLAPRF